MNLFLNEEFLVRSNNDRILLTTHRIQLTSNDWGSSYRNVLFLDDISSIEKRSSSLFLAFVIGIFLLIGGTYTPIIFRYVPFNEAVFFMSTMWGIILLGIVFKLFFTGRLEWLSISLYVFLGWMLVFVAKPISQTMPLEVFMWILYGSFAYMIGIFFYRWRSKKYSHAVWHCLTLSGTMAHFIAIYKSFV